MGKINLLTILLGLLLMQLTQNGFDFWLKYYLDDQSNSLIMINFGTTIFILSLAHNISTLLRAFSFAYGFYLASKNIFKELISKVLFAKMRFFDSSSIGSIIIRFSGDTSAADDSIPFQLNIFLKNIFDVLGSFTVIFILYPYVLVFLPFIIWYLLKIQRKFRLCQREIKRLDSLNSGCLIA